MLNELLMADRGAREANLKVIERHPDLKDARSVPTLVVMLGLDGQVVSIQPLPPEVKPWALRDGKQNSFPFVQKVPLALAAPPSEAELRSKALDRRAEPSSRRAALRELAATGQFCAGVSPGWPGSGLVARLRERHRQLRALEGTPGSVVLTTIERFIRAVEPHGNPESQRLLQTVAERLAGELLHSAQDDWLEVATNLLIGEYQKSKNSWESRGALLFDAAGAELPIYDRKIVFQQVSQALIQAEGDGGEAREKATCALTGRQSTLLSGSFPEPSLPVLGPTLLFARNPDIAAHGRYGRFSTNTMPVGKDTAIRLAAVFEALTSADRRGVTWVPIPGEAPQQRDLLLAFVERVPEAAAAGLLAQEEADRDLSEEVPNTAEMAAAESIAAFEKRTERVINAVCARVGADFRGTTVRVAVFRNVDPANRKVVCVGTATVGELHQAAVNWAGGERNVPEWVKLPMFSKSERTTSPAAPPHVAPLGVIPFSRQLFVRRGRQRQEVIGLPAAEALALFLGPVGEKVGLAHRRVTRLLRLVLGRRGQLVSGTAHTIWRGAGTREQFDIREALRTVTMLGVLLHKLGRAKEEYMSATAFKLGQLLAAADVVHAGYCADVRGGSLPPSLLGNQVFNLAQSAPDKALATLSRRWKPYEGWAQKAARDRGRAERLMASKSKDDKQRGWDIRVALRHAREMKPLAQELAASFAECRLPDDAFRAELLLGYIAGLPKSRMHEPRTGDDAEEPTGQED
jgi:hypothetical protein